MITSKVCATFKNWSDFWSIILLLFADITNAPDLQLPSNNKTCGANSFQLRDSVCDESSNTAICLYDGGDCCLEFKATHLCKNCSCILEVDVDKLQDSFDRLNILPLVDPSKLVPAVNDIWTVQVEDVVSGQVCAVLCLDHELADNINSWYYQEHTKVCRCGWIGAQVCPENLVDHDGTDLETAAKTTSAYVQLEKSLPCGMSH